MKFNIKNIIVSIVISLAVILQYNIISAYAFFENTTIEYESSTEEITTNPPDVNSSDEVITDDTDLKPKTIDDSSNISNDDTSTSEESEEEVSDPAPTVNSENTQPTEESNSYDPIEISDPALKNAIESQLNIDGSNEVINTSNILNLTSLNASGLGISNLNGLEQATNLTYVDLSDNHILDFSPVYNIAQNLGDLDKITIDKGSDIIISIGNEIPTPTNLNNQTPAIESITPNGDIKDSQIHIYNIQNSDEYTIDFQSTNSWSLSYIINIEVKDKDFQDKTDISNTDKKTGDINDTKNNLNIYDNNTTNNDNSLNINDNSQNTIINNNINTVTRIKNVINKNNFISNLSKIKINAENQTLYVGDEFNALKNVTASDSDGSDITKNIVITNNTVITNENNIAIQAGQYEVSYEVTGKSGETIYKTINVSVYNYSEEKTEDVKTGDNSIIIFIMLGVIAVLALVIINIILRKKK